MFFIRKALKTTSIKKTVDIHNIHVNSETGLTEYMVYTCH